MNEKNPLPYGRQQIDEDDIQAVCDVLRSDYLTTGPMVEKFEQKIAQYTHNRFGVSVNSGTAALHAAMSAIDIGPGDEVIVPPVTFAATANAVAYQGGTPVFADVDPDTLLIDPEKVEQAITSETKAIIAVDYAGQMCNYIGLQQIAKNNNLILVSDACHSLGGSFNEKPAGSLADLSLFSFHPVKQITTGEGGMVVTNDAVLAEKMMKFRNHGINRDFKERQATDSWYYEIDGPGYNYRLTDFQCALGISQLKKLDSWVARRNEIAKIYNQYFSTHNYIQPLKKNKGIRHAWHLYVVKIDFQKIGMTKQEMFLHFKQQNIFLNVHYVPVHLHPVYINRFKTKKGLCPVSEKAYEQIFSLPIFPAMTEEDATRVIQCFVQLTGV